MKLKPIAVIAVLVLVVASLSIAGCTTSTTSNTNQSPSATSSTATHDAFLEKFLAAFKKNEDLDKNHSTNAWDVTWINDTSARLNYTYKDTSGTRIKTINVVVIFTAFPTTQDATNYLNAMNKTRYSLVSTICTGGPGPYQDAAGHDPQICKMYQRIPALNLSEYRAYYIVQMDNIIMDSTLKYLD